MAPVQAREPPRPAIDHASERAKVIDRLDLTFPLPARKAGAPNRQRLWEECLEGALKQGRYAELAKVETKTVPSWWRRGSLLYLDDEVIVSGSSSSHVSPTVEETHDWPTAVGQENGEAPDAPAEPANPDAAAPRVSGRKRGRAAPKEKRPKVTLPKIAQVWFLDFAKHMRDTKDWKTARSWEYVGSSVRILACVFESNRDPPNGALSLGAHATKVLAPD